MEQQVNLVVESVRSFLVELGQFLPKLLGAVVVLVAGWLIARFALFVIVKGLRAVSFNALTGRAGLDDFLKKGGIRKDTVDVLGILVYWLVVLATLLVTFNLLGLTVVSELFSRVTQFIPNVIVAVLILAIGLYFARFVAEAVTTYGRNVGLQDAELIGRLSRYAIAVFVVVVALGQMNIADRILYPAFLILFGGIVLAGALAFGLGGQKWAAGQLDRLMAKEKR
jgi:hypothetical protein